MDGITDAIIGDSNPGLYFHFPFCRKACHYCNFHFSTQLKNIPKALLGMKKELDLRQGYLSKRKLNSIYFGGGTPSLMDYAALRDLIIGVEKYYQIPEQIEITIEANPDDITPEKIKMWLDLPINRVSLGIQSFNDEDLVAMNRAHNAKQAHQSVELLMGSGLNNLTLDLIFGGNTTTDKIWEENIDTALSYGVQHLSCYGLTVEPKTALDYQIRLGKEKALDDQKAARQYLFLMDRMKDCNWHHYEISNFSKPGFEAKHNSSYWNGIPYLGIGPSAHSFDGKSRQWNIANNQLYLHFIESGQLEHFLFEKEELGPNEVYNERLMLGLRQSRGIEFQFLQEESRQSAESWMESGHLVLKANRLILSPFGKILADKIISELFI